MYSRNEAKPVTVRTHCVEEDILPRTYEGVLLVGKLAQEA